MESIVVNVNTLVGTLVVVGNDVPTEQIEKQISEALKRVIDSASQSFDKPVSVATESNSDKSE